MSLTRELLQRRNAAVARHDAATQRWWPNKEAPAFRLLSGGGGPRERNLRLRLAIRLNEADRELVAAGADDDAARRVEEELIRPQVVEARRFMARLHPCLTTPLWPSEPGRADPAVVLYSGAEPLRRALGLRVRARRELTGAGPRGAVAGGEP